jgi:tetratricopeptide (TPR) repeat protein
MNENDEFAPMLRYLKWCGLAITFWFLVNCTPATHAYPWVLGGINTLLAILLLPGLLGLFAIWLLMKERHAGVLACLFPALLISEILNLVPGNPFALGLPFFRLTQILALLSLEKNAEAERICRRLLEELEETKPANPIVIARTRAVLGAALARLGKFEESEEMLRLSISGMEGQTGANRSDIAASMVDLAAILSRIGKVDASLEFGNRALLMLERSPEDEEHATTPELRKRQRQTKLGMTLNNLAVCYDEAGQFLRAEELYQRSLDIKLELFGPQSREAVMGYNNLACAILNQEQYDRALEYAERAQNTAVTLKLQNVSLWPAVLCTSGDAHRGAGQLDKAKKELEESLRLREKRKCSQLHETWYELAKLYRDKGDFSKAESFFEKTLKYREKRLGVAHPKVGQTLSEYAKLLRLKKCDSEAEQMEQRALAINEQMTKS